MNGQCCVGAAWPSSHGGREISLHREVEEIRERTNSDLPVNDSPSGRLSRSPGSDGPMALFKVRCLLTAARLTRISAEHCRSDLRLQSLGDAEAVEHTSGERSG